MEKGVNARVSPREEDSYALFREWKERRESVRSKAVLRSRNSPWSILKRNGAVMVGSCESGWSMVSFAKIETERNVCG